MDWVLLIPALAGRWRSSISAAAVPRRCATAILWLPVGAIVGVDACCRCAAFVAGVAGRAAS